MKVILRLLIIILTFVLIAVAIGKSQTPGIDPGVPDTLLIDSISAYPTGTGVVPVRFVNDEELTAIEVTLEHGTTAVAVDSFSFIGSRLDYISNKGFLVQGDGTQYTFYAQVLNEELIAAGDGLLGKIYYSWEPSIAPQLVTIDTVTTVDSFYITRSTSFRPNLGNPFTPQSVPGYIDIQASPFVMDSIWLDSVQAQPGEQIAMDIHLFNERDVKTVSVVLDYSSDDLIYDSVGFQSTRGQNANSKQVQHSASFNKLWTIVRFTDDIPLEPGTGPIAKVYFTINPDAPDEKIFIDTTLFFTSGSTFIDLTVADGSEQFVPFFTPGLVHVATVTDVLEIVDDGILPEDYQLGQNYPNPFNPSTVVEFAMPRAGHARLEVYNILGQGVRSLVDQELPAGTHRVTFNGRGESGAPLASGVYLYRLTVDDFVETRKMMLVK